MKHNESMRDGVDIAPGCWPFTGVQPFLDLNVRMNQANVPYTVHEGQIENWLVDLESRDESNRGIYWLVWIKLFEATLLCGGNYADNGEYQAAGDLIVNPREIQVYSEKTGEIIKKCRRGSLIEQFQTPGQSRNDVIQNLSRNHRLKVVKPPILTYMFDRMRMSSFVTAAYLDWARTRMEQIADTLAFLASWQIEDGLGLHRKLSQSNPETRSFIRSHLCRFDDYLFNLTGVAIQDAANNPDHPAPSLKMFICG